MKSSSSFCTQGIIAFLCFLMFHVHAFMPSYNLIFVFVTEETPFGRIKRGRGAADPRMDETGPYLPRCPHGEPSACSDVRENSVMAQRGLYHRSHTTL